MPALIGLMTMVIVEETLLVDVLLAFLSLEWWRSPLAKCSSAQQVLRAVYFVNLGSYFGFFVRSGLSPRLSQHASSGLLPGIHC